MILHSAVIMVFFYVLNSSLNPVEAHEPKHFDANHSAVKQPFQPVDTKHDRNDTRFKLLAN